MLATNVLQYKCVNLEDLKNYKLKLWAMASWLSWKLYYVDHGCYIVDHGGYFVDHGGYIVDHGSYMLDGSDYMLQGRCWRCLCI